MRLFILIIIALFTLKGYSQSKYESFEGYVGKEDYYSQNNEAQMFCNFMAKNEGNIVYLMLFLDDEQNLDILRPKDEYSRLIFTVKHKEDENYIQGAEYLIHLTKSNKYYYDYNESAKRIDGYFKIWNLSGPHQGLYSINLRPVKVD